MRYMALFALLIFLALPAYAQPADIYPPLTSGMVTVDAQVGEVASDRADTASLGIIQTNAASGEALLICAPSVIPGQTVRFSSVTVENPGDGTPGVLKARAYSVSDCTGDLTEDSQNAAYVLFSGPSAPTLVPFGSDPPDVVIP